MAARRPFWKWHRWKSIGFCLWPPSTCIWNLKLKFKSKLDLCSGNHVVYRQTDGQTDRRTDKVNPVYPPSNFVGRGYKNNPSRTTDATEQTRFSKSRSNDLEDIGQGQRSSHATHLLMLVIICTKYGKTPSGTVDATERTRFSRPRPNDLEDLGQGQRSLYATHPLILVIICAKYGKNPLRTVGFFFQVQGRKI